MTKKESDIDSVNVFCTDKNIADNSLLFLNLAQYKMLNVTQDIEIIQILNKKQSCALLNNQSSPLVSSDLSYTDYFHFLSLQMVNQPKIQWYCRLLSSGFMYDGNVNQQK